MLNSLILPYLISSWLIHVFMHLGYKPKKKKSEEKEEEQEKKSKASSNLSDSENE